MSNFSSRGTTIAVCCRRLGVAVTDSSCTLRYSGSFKLSLARSWTDFVWVAENSKVCLFLGSCEIIAFKAFLNPTSRIRSASSRTKTCSLARKFHPNQKLNKQYYSCVHASASMHMHVWDSQNKGPSPWSCQKRKRKMMKKNIMMTWSWEHSKFGVSSMCWRSRPGVQTNMFSSCTRSFSVSTSLRPPIRRPALKLWCFPTDLNTSNSWPANSRVGDMMILPTPSSGPHLSLYNFSRIWN